MKGQDQRKPTILTLTLGHVFNDFDLVDVHLKQLEVHREVANIFNNVQLQRMLGMLEKNEVDAIETRHLRYWQENWERVGPILGVIETFARANNIPMLNSPAMFRWIGNKGGYLTALAHNGIPIIPTKLLGPYDRLRLAEYLKDKPHGIVIKPSIAAKAFGLEFIRHHPDGWRYIVEIPQESRDGQPSRLTKELYNSSQLQAHFEEYSKKHRSNESNRKQFILLQDLVVQKLEISCIMIRGMKPYYIKRAEGTTTRIAHEAFGGKNEVESSPEKDLERFAQAVRKAMPEYIRDEAIVRVDILKCGNKLMLLEIETGSLRLFNEKELANNSDQYAGVLARVAKNSHALLLKHRQRKGAVNPNLAPAFLILP